MQSWVETSPHKYNSSLVRIFPKRSPILKITQFNNAVLTSGGHYGWQRTGMFSCYFLKMRQCPKITTYCAYFKLVWDSLGLPQATNFQKIWSKQNFSSTYNQIPIIAIGRIRNSEGKNFKYYEITCLSHYIGFRRGHFPLIEKYSEAMIMS